VQPPPDAQASGSTHKAWSTRLPGGFSPLANLRPVLEHRAVTVPMSCISI